MLQSARRAVLDVDIDFEELARRLTSVCGSLAGALWGAGLAVFVDSVLTAPSRPPPTAYLPGAAATAALTVMTVVPRHALADLDAAYDPATASAKRAALFAALVLAFGSVAGAVAVAGGAPPGLGRVGGGALGQTALTLVAALLLWGFRAPPDDGGFYSAY